MRSEAGLVTGLLLLRSAVGLFLLIAFLLGGLPIFRFGVGRAIFGKCEQPWIRKNGNLLRMYCSLWQGACA